MTRATAKRAAPSHPAGTVPAAALAVAAGTGVTSLAKRALAAAPGSGGPCFPAGHAARPRRPARRSARTRRPRPGPVPRPRRTRRRQPAQPGMRHGHRPRRHRHRPRLRTDREACRRISRAALRPKRRRLPWHSPPRVNLTITADRLSTVLHGCIRSAGTVIASIGRLGANPARYRELSRRMNSRRNRASAPNGGRSPTGMSAGTPADQVRRRLRICSATQTGAAPGRSPCPATRNSPCASNRSLLTTVIIGTSPSGYQPNDTLRHLVQVRDGTCTFPSCSRHARDSDFEHAQPYEKGGRTCAAMPAHEAENVTE